MIVVDTSAVLAALTGERARDRVNEVLARSARTLMSAANYVESMIVVTARYGDDGAHDLRSYLDAAGVEVVAVDRALADEAVRAWSTFGRSRHRAALNFGDCFAYALARSRGAPLLYVGDDFGHTDVVDA
jgi:ribonuclease VapC